jgi:dicarboxylate/amino acid:cation (Na+ or H+) symporter, DAACS family
MTQQQRILLGLGVGAGAGVLVSGIAPGAQWVELLIRYGTEPIGKIFIRLLLCLVVPILFSALVLGIVDIDFVHLKRLGARTLGYTVVVSVIASSIGLFLVNWLGPGRSVSAEMRSQAHSLIDAAPKPISTNPVDLIVGIVPDNPIRAAAQGDMLGLVFFSIFFGVGLLLTKTDAARTLRSCIEGLFDVSMRLIDRVLALAPIAVAALLFTTTARLGFQILVELGAYVGVVLLGLALHMFGVYSISVGWLSKRNPITFFRDIRLALTTAFSTASSNATLPTALRVAKENLGLPPHVSRFVLTAGASMNQNGTALFEGVTVLFLAQAYGIELELQRQAIVMAICVLAGIGTAGVPTGSLPVIAMLLSMLGIPVEGVGLILGVDRFLDMCRTTVNVAGDLAAAVFVAHNEPQVVAGAAEPA